MKWIQQGVFDDSTEGNFFLIGLQQRHNTEKNKNVTQLPHTKTRCTQKNKTLSKRLKKKDKLGIIQKTRAKEKLIELNLLIEYEVHKRKR